MKCMVSIQYEKRRNGIITISRKVSREVRGVIGIMWAYVGVTRKVEP